MNETYPALLNGGELLRATVNQILAYPETWDQSSWHCGTTHCVAGWCQILGKGIQEPHTCRRDARDLLEIDDNEADWLFAEGRTLDEIYRFAVMTLAGTARDECGFDRCGRYEAPGASKVLKPL